MEAKSAFAQKLLHDLQLKKERMAATQNSSNSNFTSRGKSSTEFKRNAIDHREYQILRACSNGLNFDRYSIEVGKELLRGAMDLEESLRMLVNLQEASDYMVNSQRKNKIKLIDEDEDDESESAKVNDLKQLASPRFSFDKPNRNSQHTKESAQNGINQQLVALPYPEEIPKPQEKQPRSRSNSFSHTQSGSYVPDPKTLSTYLEPKGYLISQSQPINCQLPRQLADDDGE